MKHNRWLVLFLAFLCNNVAMAITFASFGVIAPQITEDLQTTQARTALAIGLVSLMMGLCAPAIGMLLDRWSVRYTVASGCIIAAGGLYLASLAQDITTFLIAYGIVLGIGMTAMGNLAAVKLASTAFPRSTGLALGVVTLSVSMAVAPSLFGAYADAHGWRQLLGRLALLPIAILPLCWWALVHEPRAGREGAPRGVALLGPALSEPSFRLLVLVAGMLLSSSILVYAHVANHALHISYTLAGAGALVSVAGVSALTGSLGYGWLADRFNPTIAVSLNLAAQGFMWFVLATTTVEFALWVALVIGGFSGGGCYTTVSALIARRYGQHRVGTMLGQLALLVMPFNFGMPPLVGWLFDLQGSYRLAFLIVSAGCFAAIAGAIVVARSRPAAAVPGD